MSVMISEPPSEFRPNIAWGNLGKAVSGDMCPVSFLQESIARERALLRRIDDLVEQQTLLSREADHRMLNDLQLIVSLLSLQSRRTTNPEAASLLSVAANRVATVERVHRRLHCLDGTQTVAFRQYIQDLCADFATMLVTDKGLMRAIDVEAIEAVLPTEKAIPLGFVINELITNAIKYGKGRVTVRLVCDPRKGYALSVSNDGPPLPDGFDPAASKGLGMKIVQSFVQKIGGELQFGRKADGRGAQFTVLFPASIQSKLNDGQA